MKKPLLCVRGGSVVVTGIDWIMVVRPDPLGVVPVLSDCTMLFMHYIVTMCNHFILVCSRLHYLPSHMNWLAGLWLSLIWKIAHASPHHWIIPWCHASMSWRGLPAFPKVVCWMRRLRICSSNMEWLSPTTINKPKQADLSLSNTGIIIPAPVVRIHGRWVFYF